MRQLIRALQRWYCHTKAEAWREWAHVPRPVWRASRGGRDYW